MSVKILDFNDIMKEYDPNKNKSKNILSKYEIVSIIGQRSEQLARGAIPYINLSSKSYAYLTTPFNPIEVAKEELRTRRMPLMLYRIMPDKTREYWRLDDMIIPSNY